MEGKITGRSNGIGLEEGKEYTVIAVYCAEDEKVSLIGDFKQYGLRLKTNFNWPFVLAATVIGIATYSGLLVLAGKFGMWLGGVL